MMEFESVIAPLFSLQEAGNKRREAVKITGSRIFWRIPQIFLLAPSRLLLFFQAQC